MQKKTFPPSSDKVMELVRSGQASLRLRKNRWKLCGKLRRGQGVVFAAFLSQILLPAAAIAVYASLRQEPALLWAIFLYILIPFFLPLGCVSATLATGLGLAGLFLSWPPILVALFLPAELYFLAGGLWWLAIEWAILPAAMGDKLFFQELWEEGLLFVQTKDGFWGYEKSAEKEPLGSL